MSDLISRQKVMIILNDCAVKSNMKGRVALLHARNMIHELPSVELERKPGKWIRGEAYPHRIYCSECYKTFIPNDEMRAWVDGGLPRKYCPECGAKMEVDG